jgi:hypothetical protein
MTMEQLRKLYDGRPFRPFIIHLADGREIPVHHREYMAIGPQGRTFVVYQPDESLNIIDLYLVTDLEVRPNGAPPQGATPAQPAS